MDDSGAEIAVAGIKRAVEPAKAPAAIAQAAIAEAAIATAIAVPAAG
jgi:hypothetical protein